MASRIVHVAGEQARVCGAIFSPDGSTGLAEIAHRSEVSPTVALAHLRALAALGVVELREDAPVEPVAKRRNVGRAFYVELNDEKPRWSLALRASLLAWVRENTSHGVQFLEDILGVELASDRINFEDDVDAVAFNLRWSDEIGKQPDVVGPVHLSREYLKLAAKFTDLGIRTADPVLAQKFHEFAGRLKGGAASITALDATI